jgi:hypothetical protein
VGEAISATSGSAAGAFARRHLGYTTTVDPNDNILNNKANKVINE